MTTEKVEPIEIIIKDKEASGSPRELGEYRPSSISYKPVKKEKNPNRVAGGKKGVEARKMKEELLRKENEKLKEITMKIEESREVTESAKSIALLDEDQCISVSPTSLSTTRELTKNNKKILIEENSKESKTLNYTLVFLLIGIGRLGLYFYQKRKEKNPVLVVPEKKGSVQKVVQKKEIDPFEF